MPERFLSSWKEISAYTGYSERTLQRWEGTLGFPVRRPAGRSRSAVVSLSNEIDAWFRSAPMLPQLRPKMQSGTDKLVRARSTRSGAPKTVAPADSSACVLEADSSALASSRQNAHLREMAYSLMSECQTLANECAKHIEVLNNTLAKTRAIKQNMAATVQIQSPLPDEAIQKFPAS
jgi:predicted DNA-binding transcriptional regulator AlpA